MSGHLIHLEKRISDFINLGKKITILSPSLEERIIQKTQANNAWFGKESILTALKGLKYYLQEKTFVNWIKQYDFSSDKKSKRVGVIMAGNIPMAGLHDFISVLISGNILHAKLSERDNVLLRFIAQLLIRENPEFGNYIHFVSQISKIDAIIATGSNNSRRYFEYYFSRFPHIFRKNRISCALIRKEDSLKELENLGKDCLLYFGLGCRNIAKLFAPCNYDFTNLLKALQKQGQIAIKHHKYYNNYEYQKALLSIDKTAYLDNGSILLVENTSFISPIAVLYYEYYVDLSTLEKRLQENRIHIQCISSSKCWWKGSVAFGKAQFPTITDYSDKIDTLQFLLNL